METQLEVTLNTDWLSVFAGVFLVVTIPYPIGSTLMATRTGLSPSQRSHPFIASAKDTLYLWGGKGDTEPEKIFIYNLNTETWTRKFTKGPHPPAGLCNGGCILIGQQIYFYGGQYESSYSRSLYQLSTDNWTWRVLSDGSAGGPRKKRGCRMVTYKDQVVIVGGYYSDIPGPKQLGSRYDLGYTNELHCYSLTTGTWSSPSVKGSRPPSCSDFSLTMTDEEHAVMFGDLQA